MTDKEKIKEYLEYKGITKNAFNTTMGYSGKFLDSGNTLGVDRLREIIKKFPDLSLDWVVADKGPMIKGNHPIEAFLKSEYIENSYKEVHQVTKKSMVLKNEIESGDFKNVKTLSKINDQVIDDLVNYIDRHARLIDFIRQYFD